ncbi:hypothetical protein EB796_012658 [Bugula neritina]|uniref:Uncharacterized protein n=1 Tax=Bugula neritina TaxID=10212 RepID=A0A7J7JUF2_BUGNE|nr:hypothetical protein EB796_012658 [Bugula neritina]
MHKAFDSDKELWKKRPLKQEYMEYAATEVSNRRGIWNIEEFSSTGEPCISCNWRTETPHGGQCHRCYLIDHPEKFKRTYPTYSFAKRARFDDYF